MILQITEKAANSGIDYHSEMGISWFDITAILLKVVLPILLLVFTIYIIYRYLSVLKKIQGTLEDINDSIKENNPKE